MRFTGVIVGAAFALALAPAYGNAATEANFTAKTTGDLVALCDPQSGSVLDNAGINFCEGFLQGAVLVEQQHQANPRSKQFFCLPDPAPTRTEAISGFVAWAHAKPERLDMSAVDGLISFLGERYACPKKHR